MSKESTTRTYQEVYKDWRRQEEKKGFKTHLCLYLIVVPILAIVNIIFVPQFLWFFFPMVGWGIGVTMHYLFGIRKLEQNLPWETAQIDTVVNELKSN